MALELKRRVERSYSLDEMMTIVNRHFIGNEKDRPADIEPIRKFGIEPTCFPDEDRWLVTDTRANHYLGEAVVHDPPLLPCYYGATILEAVTKCFLDRANHYGETQEDKRAKAVASVKKTVNQNIIKKIKLKGIGDIGLRKTPFDG